MLFREFRPARFLEIGVYRGQILSLAAMLQQQHDISGSVTGISPFVPAGDAVSRYRTDIHYLEDTLKNFSHFGLSKPELVQAFSTDPAAIARLRSQEWDAIYIDGNHDYEVALQDWEHCSVSLRKGGIVVLDDSGLTTSYRPPAFATGGHPGPSRLAAEVDRTRFQEILQVGHNRVFQKIA
ncbi:MAG: class I SAM-dependent methyltransferase [Candidatus Methylacidiphilales bacterium]|nr:class I SAM-dependent methyltransferase [Candidatus Methylacidiphilales bacterium]